MSENLRSAGQSFAGYRLLRLLGAGGMGEVYLAQHPRLERLDAIKILPEALTRDAEYRERFMREADMAANLWHPHIVGIHDRGEFNNQLWISMDYVDGTDAARLVATGEVTGLPVGEVLDILDAIGEALDFAHARRLLHRDVKPHNILLSSPNGGKRRILLADFGIARREDEISGLTATNTTIGTVNYSAPEQLMGEKLDGRADQYALAATAFHLLTAKQVFGHTNPAVTIGKHLNSAPPALSSLRLELAPLDIAMNRALSKDPYERFATCSEFANAVRSAAENSASSHTLLASVAPRPATTAQRVDPLAATHHAPVAQQRQSHDARFNQDRHRLSRGLKIAIGGFATAVVAIAAVLTSILARDNEREVTSSPTSTVIASLSPTPTQTLAPQAAPTSWTRTPAPAAQSGRNYTIADYIKDEKIAQTPVKRGDPGTPTLYLPLTEGWADAGAKAPNFAWGQIFYTRASTIGVTPTITAIMSKLDGADPAKIVEYAPNELKNLPEYEGGNAGQTGKLGGFDAVQVGGTYVRDGQKLLIAQKTVLIPAGEDLYVLQLNAEGTEDDMGPLMDATSAIDEQTTITP